MLILGPTNQNQRVKYFVVVEAFIKMAENTLIFCTEEGIEYNYMKQ